jgi:hypothetical protein
VGILVANGEGSLARDADNRLDSSFLEKGIAV